MPGSSRTISTTSLMAVLPSDRSCFRRGSTRGAAGKVLQFAHHLIQREAEQTGELP